MLLRNVAKIQDFKRNCNLMSPLNTIYLPINLSKSVPPPPTPPHVPAHALFARHPLLPALMNPVAPLKKYGPERVG